MVFLKILLKGYKEEQYFYWLHVFINSNLFFDYFKLVVIKNKVSRYLVRNSLNYFKKFFIKNSYFIKYNVKNYKKNYLYFYILFKKQNSILKKEFNYWKNLHPIFYRKYRKKIQKKEVRKKGNKGGVLHPNSLVSSTNEYYKLKYLKKGNKKNNLLLAGHTTITGRKKQKKTLIVNKKIHKFLLNNRFKSNRGYYNHLNLTSKLKNINNYLNIEYSLSNILISSGLVKTYLDLRIFLAQGQVFLNRFKLKNFKKILNVGAFLEIILKLQVYSYEVYFRQITRKHIIRIRRRLWYKLKSVNKFKLNYNKVNFFNRMFKNSVVTFNRVPSYLEVDYYLLTVVVLIKNLNVNTFNFNLKKALNIYLYKLYCWK